MNPFSFFWLITGPVSVCLFWAAFGILMLSIRQGRRVFMLHGLFLMAVTYFIVQCISCGTEPVAKSPWVLEIAARFCALPRPLIVLLFAGLGFVTYRLCRNLIRYGKTRITPMSVKQAVDSLPGGILWYLPGGRILMINKAMEETCRKTLGKLPVSGEEIRERLFSGSLTPGCRCVPAEDTVLITAPDRQAWNISEKTVLLDGETVRGLIATDVTELYQKTVLLREREKNLSDLNERLTEYNREIVFLTAEKERLSARVRLHDEMGADLLAIKNYLVNGGSPEKREDIRARLRRNISFLLKDDAPAAEDEYELLLKTAARLGVRVITEGTLPQTEPQKHVAATAIHECFTNTLRHARGNELRVAVTESADDYVIRLTNNGEQPAEPVQERGGLASLRKLAEYAGGSLAITVFPSFTVTLVLPKEVPHAVQSADRG